MDKLNYQKLTFVLR